MATTPTGRNGRHVRQHVVSESEHVIGRAPVPCPSSEGGHAKSRASVYPVKPNTAICVSVEVCVICGLKNFEVHDVFLGVVKLLRLNVLVINLKTAAFGLDSALFPSRAS